MTASLTTRSTCHLEALRQSLEETAFRDHPWLDTERKLVEHWLDQTLAGEVAAGVDLNYDPLQSRFLGKALSVLRENLNGAQFLTAWQSWGLLRENLEQQGFARDFAQQAEAFAQGLSREMDTIFPTDDRAQLPEREKLEEAILEFTREWCSAAQTQSAARGAWEAIRQFHLQVTRRLRAPLQYWQILLARMDLQAGERMRTGRNHPWRNAFKVIEETLYFQDAIRRFFDALEESAEEAVAFAWLPVCAALRAAPNAIFESLTLRAEAVWFEGLQPDPENLGESAEWRRLIRREVERSDLDFLDAGRLWLSALTRSTETTESLLASSREALASLAESLSQGMKGSDAAPTMRRNLRFLLEEALWAGLLANDGLPSRLNFLVRVVEFGGIDLSLDSWRKLTQMVAALRKLVGDTPGLAAIRSVDWLLAELDEHRKSLQALTVYEKEGLPLFQKWLKSAHTAGAEKGALINWIEERVRADLRLRGVERAAAGSLAWLTREELPFIETPNLDFVAALLGEGTRIIESGMRGGSIIAPVLRAVADGFERSTAGFRLIKDSWKMGDEVAGEVFQHLPEYAEKVGAAGRQSCQRDNALTMGKVADLLLDGSEDAGEQLNEWWNSLVGGYVASRPERLFHINLNALHGSFTRHLTPREAALAFAPIQFVYRESLGIECRAAKAAVIPQPLGQLGRALLQERSGYHTLFAIEEKSAEGEGSPARAEAERLFKSLLLGLNERGDIELAGQPLLTDLVKAIGAHGATTVAAETLAYAQSLLIAEGLVRWPAAEAAREWVKIIEQVAFGLLLENHRDEIAGYFGEAMIQYMPDHFAHLSQEAAVEKCQRDQGILLQNWSLWLTRETPCVAWLAGFRYYLELLLPFVEYPAVIWQMSARTIEKFLCGRADAAEYGGLCRFVAQMESMSHGLAEASAVSRKFFDLEDYTFSADSVEEAASRSLLSAAMACAAATRAPLDAHQLAVHFLLSDSLGDRADSASVVRLTEKIRAALGEHLRPPVAAQLEALADLARKAEGLAESDATAPGIMRALRPRGAQSDGFWKALLVGACTDPEAQALSERDNLLLEELKSGETPSKEAVETVFSSWMKALGAITPPEATANEDTAMWSGLLSLLLHPITPAGALNASAYSADLGERLAENARYLGTHLEQPPATVPAALEEILGDQRPLAAQWAQLRQKTSEVAAALRLDDDSGATATHLIDRLENGEAGPYSNNPEGRNCDRTANERAFHFVFKRLGRTHGGLAGYPPKVFLGDPLENYGRFKSSVINNAYTQMSGQLLAAAEDTADRLRAAAALASMALRETAAHGHLWQALASSRISPEKDLFARFEASVPALVADVARDLNIGPEGADFGSLLSAQLRLFSRHFAESGDFEAGVEAFKAMLAGDVGLIGGETLVAAYECLAVRAGAADSAGEGLFWQYLIEQLDEALREFLLGEALLGQLDTAPEELARTIAAQSGAGIDTQALSRDTRLLLLMMAHSLSRQGRSRGSLNTLRFILENFLSCKDPGELPGDGVIPALEQILHRSLPPKTGHTAHAVFGFYGQAFAQLQWAGRFWKEAAPTTVKTLVAEGQTRDEAIDFFSGILASALAPGESPYATARALLARVILGHTHSAHAHEKTLGTSLENLRAAWEHDGLTIPGPFSRRMVEMPLIAGLIGECLARKASPHVRFAAIMGKDRAGRPLWRASLFARLDPASGFFETDPLDPLAARECGFDLPDDRLLQSQLRLHTNLRSLRQLPLEAPPPPQQSGLMGLFKKTPVPQKPKGWSDPRLRRHTQRLASALFWKEILGDFGKGASETEPLPDVDIRAYDYGMAESEKLYLEALAGAAAKEWGEGQSLVRMLRDLPAQNRRRRLAAQLKGRNGKLNSPVHFFLGLFLLGERCLDEATLYSGERNETPEDLLRKALDTLEAPENSALHAVAAEIRQLARQA
ncbi:MAG: hypothetical protein JJT96_11720 [Opitutales bacterium]|nr:hypothetical protein [Opitutales bacterium]